MPRIHTTKSHLTTAITPYRNLCTTGMSTVNQASVAAFDSLGACAGGNALNFAFRATSSIKYRPSMMFTKGDVCASPDKSMGLVAKKIFR